jgi:multiple sugar transport system permease protein
MATVFNPGATRRPFPLTLVFIYLLLIVISIIMIVPFVWMVLTSVKVDAEIFGMTPRWIPSQLDWANYTDAYRSINMGLLFRNTTFVTVADVAAQILLGSMAG